MRSLLDRPMEVLGPPPVRGRRIPLPRDMIDASDRRNRRGPPGLQTERMAGWHQTTEMKSSWMGREITVPASDRKHRGRDGESMMNR